MILYSTNCPKCRILKDTLKRKGFKFKEVNDKKTIIEKGFLNVPVLEVHFKQIGFDDLLYDQPDSVFFLNFDEALKYIKENSL